MDKEDTIKRADYEKEITELQAKVKTLENQQQNLMQNFKTLYEMHMNQSVALEAAIQALSITTGKLAEAAATYKFQLPTQQQTQQQQQG